MVRLHLTVTSVAADRTAAYLEHGVTKVAIFDIDLHHGNGTQQIVWRLNELANKAILEHKRKLASPRKGSPKKAAATFAEEPSKPPLQLYYGSLHDVNSYRTPCLLHTQSYADTLYSLRGHGSRLDRCSISKYIRWWRGTIRNERAP